MPPAPWTFDRAFPGALTVRELIDLLSTLPEDARVVSEGCDCDGPVADIMVDQPFAAPANLPPITVVTLTRGKVDSA